MQSVDGGAEDGLTVANDDAQSDGRCASGLSDLALDEEEEPTVFISLRYKEAGREAKLLQKALDKHEIKSFICEPENGERMVKLICRNLRRCQLYVIFASRTYGIETGSPCATDFELESIMDMEKRYRRPVCIARMIEWNDRFEDDVCALYVGRSKLQHVWLPNQPVPEDFVNSIVKRHALHLSRSDSLGAVIPPSSSGSLPLPMTSTGEGAESPPAGIFFPHCPPVPPFPVHPIEATRAAAPPPADAGRVPEPGSTSSTPSSWEVGSAIPSEWRNGSDYAFKPEHKFFIGELAVFTKPHGPCLCRIVGDAIGCPGQHQLHDKIAEERWTCDVCHKEATPGETLNDCRLCDWDACEDCRLKADTHTTYQVVLMQEASARPIANLPAEMLGKIAPHLTALSSSRGSSLPRQTSGRCSGCGRRSPSPCRPCSVEGS